MTSGRSAPGLEILVHDLQKSFGSRPVLAGIDLAIPSGDLVAIVGGSGCGKTVLMDHMFGQLQPDRGGVQVADHDRAGAPLTNLAVIDEQHLDRIRMHWSVVFQHNALFSGTVHENIALWLREVRRLGDSAIDERVGAALVSVGLDAAEVAPKQREELSGGMAKRVAVARALAMEPLLLFYDEPTTGLDPRYAAQIHELIVATHDRPPTGERRTSVIITHDKDLLRRLRPRVVMLHDGRVLFDGPYDEFERSDSPVVRPYFDLMPVLHQRVMQG